MASKDIYTISSSPPRRFTTYNMSSPLPSPSEALTKKVPILCTGSRSTPVPQDATASFTSASSLLRRNQEERMDTIRSFALEGADDNVLGAKRQSAKPRSKKPVAAKDRGDGEVAKKPRMTALNKDVNAADGATATKPRKPRTKKAEEAGEDGIAKGKAPRKSRAKKIVVEPGATKEKAAPKPRAKKRDGDTQTKLPKGQVTKSLDDNDNSVVAKRKDKVATAHDRSTISLDHGLDHGLDPAVKRRADWTPPSLTVQNTSLITPIPVNLLGGGLSSGCSKPSAERSQGFQDLFGNFGFSKLESDTAAKIMPHGAGIKKRKLIELAATTTFNTAPKAKAPKKKARTVTEAATSAYAEEVEESGKTSSLLQYFSSETIDGANRDVFKVPPKPQSKSPVKARKGTAQAPILLSPESALKQVGNQDFVFGTSSQLAREESPTFLRDIHAAMQASNQADMDDPFASLPSQFYVQCKTIPLSSRNLWSAAARDGGGKLLDVEMVDLADTPAAARHFSTVAAPSESPLEDRQGDGEAWRDIEDLAEASTSTKAVEESPKSVGPVEAAISFELLSSPASGAKSPTKSSTQPTVSSKAFKAASSKTKKSKDLEAPDFEAYTMAQLTKELASYHFKPVKSRDQMIALLERCWESKQRMAMGVISPNLPIRSPKKASKLANEPPPSCQPQAASPKRPRGRPKKNSSCPSTPKRKTKTASLANALARAQKKAEEAAEEISDSDTPPTPSPLRRHPSQIGTPALPLQLSSSVSVDDRDLSPTSSQDRLFRHITSAIKDAPSSTDSSNPSWHEKILLYDPIILEDLTVWLNTGALAKAGWDGEVDPREVKKWCESKSICCLWKDNLRGGTRSRY